MEYNDLRKMLLLEAIEKNPEQSQRSLSADLDMSLGMVNSLIKALRESDMLDIGYRKEKKAGYALTAKGVQEIKRLQLHCTSDSIIAYSKVKDMVRIRMYNMLNSGHRKLIIYGLGEFCEIVSLLLEEKNRVQRWIVDDLNAGRYVCGIKIHPDSEMKHIDYDAVLITDLKNNGKTRKELVRKGVPEDKIFTIFGHDNDEK